PTTRLSTLSLHDALPILLARRQRDAHRDHVAGVESGVDALQRTERAEHQPRADEQHDRERDLRDDKRMAQPLAADTAADLSRPKIGKHTSELQSRSDLVC